MELAYINFIVGLPSILIIVIIGICFLGLTKGGDILVDEAVHLSLISGIPKAIIGATIVSLGTTLPETIFSVFSALEGKASLALGNAVGSIICNTGLVLGVATLISPLSIESKNTGWQLTFQNGLGLVLLLACWPWSSPGLAFQIGGHLSRFMGVIFLLVLAGYILYSINNAKKPTGLDVLDPNQAKGSKSLIVLKMLGGALLVVVASKAVIPCVTELALRLSIPEGVVAATLVAFGTSLPEFVTAVVSAIKGHGELGIGNVLGANILNFVLVIGLSTILSKNGLSVDAYFFKMVFPFLVLVLSLLTAGLLLSKTKLSRFMGSLLLTSYAVFAVLSYLIPS